MNFNQDIWRVGLFHPLAILQDGGPGFIPRAILWGRKHMKFSMETPWKSMEFH